jgi:hypothetical protein
LDVREVVGHGTIERETDTLCGIAMGSASSRAAVTPPNAIFRVTRRLLGKGKVIDGTRWYENRVYSNTASVQSLEGSKA